MSNELSNSDLGASRTSQVQGLMFGRRSFMQAAAVAVGSAVVAACGGNSANTTSPNAGLTPEPTLQSMSNSAISATMTASVNKVYFPSGDPNVPDAYTGPWPTFQSVFYKPGRGGSVKVFGPQLGTPPTPHDKNRYWQELEKRLNVKWDVNLVPFDAYGQKAATLLAGGDMPELFFIDLGRAPSLLTAMRQGAFADLTPYLTGSAIHDYPNLARFPEQVWKNVAVNGKIYSVPRPRSLVSQVLFYRKDWLDAQGLAAPQSTNDFLNMLKAFTKSGSTWGWGFAGAEPTLTAYNSQFFMNIFSVPNLWRQEADGKLTYFIETDEYKQALSFLRQIYSAGLVYPDSVVQASQKLDANFNAGKYGTVVNGFTGLQGYIQNTQLVDPKAKIEVLVPFNADGNKGNHWFSSGYFGATAIPSSVAKDPERVKELLRVLNYLVAPPFSEEATFLGAGIDGWDNTVAANGTRKRTQTGNDEISTLVYIANGPVVFASADNFALTQQQYARQLLKIGVKNPVVALTSPTQGTQGSVLAELLNDRLTRIIKGTDPLSALSDVITLWNQQGGAQIKQEYQQALGNK